MSTDSLDSRYVSHLFRVQVGLSDQMILDVAKHEAVLTFSVDKVAHSLRVVELSLAELSFLIAHLAVSDLLDELVGGSVKDEVTIVGGVCHDK